MSGMQLSEGKPIFTHKTRYILAQDYYLFTKTHKKMGKLRGAFFDRSMRAYTIVDLVLRIFLIQIRHSLRKVADNEFLAASRVHRKSD